MTDEFTLAMYEAQAALAERAVNEVNKLRREISELKRERAELPGTVWDLHERIAMLEKALKEKQEAIGSSEAAK